MDRADRLGVHAQLDPVRKRARTLHLHETACVGHVADIQVGASVGAARRQLAVHGRVADDERTVGRRLVPHVRVVVGRPQRARAVERERPALHLQRGIANRFRADRPASANVRQTRRSRDRSRRDERSRAGVADSDPRRRRREANVIRRRLPRRRVETGCAARARQVRDSLADLGHLPAAGIDHEVERALRERDGASFGEGLVGERPQGAFAQRRAARIGVDAAQVDVQPGIVAGDHASVAGDRPRGAHGKFRRRTIVIV